MIRQLFSKDVERTVVTIDKEHDLIIATPEGDDSIYFYIRDYIHNNSSLLVEWKHGKWNVDPHNKDKADEFFYYMKQHYHIYKNFVKKVIQSKNKISIKVHG